MCKDKDKHVYESLFGLYVSVSQTICIRESTIRENMKSFLCFVDATKTNNSCDDSCNHIENENQDFKYAGTITVFPPNVNAKYGFEHITNSYGKHLEKIAMKFFDRVADIYDDPLQSIYPYIKHLVWDGLLVEFNEQLVLKKIKLCLESYWFMVNVNINPKYQSKGIATRFIKHIFNSFVIPSSKKSNHSGFCLLAAGNPRLINFYIRNGYQLLTEFKLPLKTTDDGQIVDTSYVLLLWHWDEKKCSDMIDQLRKEYGIDKQTEMLTMAECIKYKVAPKWLHVVPAKLIFLGLLLIDILLWYLGIYSFIFSLLFETISFFAFAGCSAIAAGIFLCV